MPFTVFKTERSVMALFPKRHIFCNVIFGIRYDQVCLESMENVPAKVFCRKTSKMVSMFRFKFPTFLEFARFLS